VATVLYLAIEIDLVLRASAYHDDDIAIESIDDNLSTPGMLSEDLCD